MTAKNTPKQTTKRVVFVVRWDARWEMWKWGERGSSIASYTFVKRKKLALDQAVQEIARLFIARGIRAQLVIHDRAGKIQSERTYGADPRRTPG